jgi:hypothetical protein
MRSTFYDFKIGGENRGFCEVRDDGHEIYMRAVFEMDGSVYNNEFGVRYQRERVVAFRYGAGSWRSFEFPPDHYPSAAYPILLRRLFQELTYVAVDDETGRIRGTTRLLRKRDTVVEKRRGKTERVFTMRAGKVVRVDWGGPISDVRSSLEAAVAGSPLAGRDLE